MARPLWKGTLSFGLVSIPVELYTAVRDLGPHFHFLRRSDKSRIGYQKVAKADGRIVAKDELVKGFEYEKDRYIVLKAEDFEAAAVKRNSRIDLLDFVAGDQVDDRYFSKPYYLLPGSGGEQAYALLREALRESGRIGIAKLVMRDKPHLAAVEAIKNALVLTTMRFREELVPVAAYEFPEASVRQAELKMAHQLIEALVAEWDPDKYTDEYRRNLREIIEAKLKRQKPELERQERDTDSNVVDLMERLRRSLGGAAGEQATAARRGQAKSATRSGGRGTSSTPPRRAASKRAAPKRAAPKPGAKKTPRKRSASSSRGKAA
jgi:DNA end-binding protein Ku